MRTNNRAAKWWRRGVAAAGVACLTSVSIGALLATPAPADTPASSAGTAQATAQAFKVNPTAASLSVGFTFGQSLAGYQNQVAKADARGIDLGIIGTLLAAAGCDGGAPTLPADQQPQPLQADSRDPAANQGISRQETLNKSPIPVINMHVKATPEPLGEAGTDYGGLTQAGLFNVSGAQSSAVTHVINGNTREAIATADIGSLNLGGQVKLAGLHFQAVHRTGAVNEHTGTFTIGSASIGGQTLPTGDPKAVIAAVNQVLNTIGIEIHLPNIYAAGDRVQVDPFTIAVVPNPARDAISQNLLNATLPVRQALVDALFAASCKFHDLVSVLDIAVGSVTGSGSFALELGGVSASTGELKLTNALGGGLGADLGPGVAAPSLGDAAAGTAAIPGTSGSLGTGGAPASLGGSSGGG
ncbi:MAG: hypothetical protein ACJ786_18115, partial [Catenulispora sp.]